MVTQLQSALHILPCFLLETTLQSVHYYLPFTDEFSHLCIHRKIYTITLLESHSAAPLCCHIVRRHIKNHYFKLQQLYIHALHFSKLKKKKLPSKPASSIKWKVEPHSTTNRFSISHLSLWHIKIST